MPNWIPSSVSAGVFIVGTSGTQFPSSHGRLHSLQTLNSNVIWVAGVSTVNSGVGFAIMGDPATDIRTKVNVEIGNLSLLYGKAQTVSGLVSFISYNY